MFASPVVIEKFIRLKFKHQVTLLLDSDSCLSCFLPFPLRWFFLLRISSSGESASDCSEDSFFFFFLLVFSSRFWPTADSISAFISAAASLTRSVICCFKPTDQECTAVESDIFCSTSDFKDLGWKEFGCILFRNFILSYFPANTYIRLGRYSIQSCLNKGQM